MEYLAPRPVTRADIDTLVRHRCEMFVAMGTPRDAALDVMARECGPWLRNHIASGDYAGFLIETADAKREPVAGGGVIFHDWPPSHRDTGTLRAYILNIYVEPEHRRRGLARIVTKACIDACRARGVKTVSLHAADAGRPLYEQIGFAPTNEMRLELTVGVS
jgi:ribosomal protein S18 acetylase RimI-like enzyme